MFDQTSNYNVLNYPQKDIDRFWSKVQVQYKEDGTPDFEACMIWTAGKFYDGADGSPYGAFHFRYRTGRAHRFIYTCFNGLIPNGLCVCHTCDNPTCVNPNHLWLGTNQQNTADRHQKGRSLKGSKNGFSILTENDVVLIKRFLQQKVRHKDIADYFGVSRPTITDINLGYTWSHITV